MLHKLPNTHAWFLNHALNSKVGKLYFKVIIMLIFNNNSSYTFITLMVLSYLFVLLIKSKN